jgi:radical SAM superfamily enzyme with C-terminal helix-hairpin-helix motif
MKTIIIDGYVDEPTCLGVPFYISTYIRYVAGALKLSVSSEADYITIDDLRSRDFELGDYDYSVIIAGNPVPGKYLGGIPIKANEFSKIAKTNPSVRFLAGGPVSFTINADFDNLKFVEGDIEAYIVSFFGNGKCKSVTREINDLNRYAVAGAFITEKHPRFPDIIAEIETGRGCPRLIHCSFCIEGTYPVVFRDEKDIISEMKSLYDFGVRHFRIGKQADLFAYKSDLQNTKNGFSKPSPAALEALFSGIRDSLPDLKTLHIDNVNPGTIANFPDESYKIMETVAKYNTAGDVAALGMESADLEVISKNGLKASPDEVYRAIRMLNEAGGFRVDGIPKLLPGINLIRGLPGETRRTFVDNYEFLKRVYDDGLMLRRINIRQINLLPGTRAFNSKRADFREEKKLDAIFRNYRRKIRDEIDEPMLKRVFPAGTVFTDTVVEQIRGDRSLARNIGTYPIVINIPKKLPVLSRVSVFIVGYRERSLVGLQCPLRIASASLAELKQIPGLGKRAGELFVKKKIMPEDIAGSPVCQFIKKHLIF